jgi:site-specific DNA-cytosine methylase
MRVADFSANVGGFLEGFRKAGHQIVCMCEQDKNARAVLEANFGHPATSLASTPVSYIPHADVVCSLGGLRAFLGYIKGILPRAIVAEYESVTAAAEAVVLNDYQVYQESLGRGVVVVAIRNDVKTPFLSFPFPLARPRPKMSDIIEADAPGELLLGEGWRSKLEEEEKKNASRSVRFRCRILRPDDEAPRIPSNYHKYGHDPLVDDCRGPRRLSVLECKRIAGFDDSYKMPVSRTHAYRLLASATNPKMAEDVANELETWLG